MKSSKYFLLTIDVEDWFQVENFKTCIPFSTWSERELRVEANTHRLLDLFDSINLKKSSCPINPTNPSNPKATFFILGWVAERFPHLVKEIRNRGHEIASHGYDHDLCYQLPTEVLKKDLRKSKTLLEDIIGESVQGYRGPNFSVNDDILKIIEEIGYKYDSSYNSFSMHDRYGKLDLSEQVQLGIAYKMSNAFYEIPISNLILNFINFHLPLGGGGYFRLFPFSIFKLGIQSLLKKDSAYVFYLHPWEIDPQQPRVDSASSSFKFRHYINLKKTYSKLSNLINSFKHCNFITCREYIEKIDN